jgi:hypothetical protein
MELACGRLGGKPCDDITQMDTSDEMQHSLEESSLSSASHSLRNDYDDPYREHVDYNEIGGYKYPFCDPFCFSSGLHHERLHTTGSNDLGSVKTTTALTTDISLLPSSSMTPNDILTATTNMASDCQIDDVSNNDKETVDENELSFYCNGVSVTKEHCNSPSREPTSAALQTPSLLDQLDIWFEKLCFSSDISMENTSFPSTFVPSGTSRSYWLSMESIIASLGSCDTPERKELDQFGSYESLLETNLLSCCFPTAVSRIATEQTLSISKTTLPRRGATRKQCVLEQLLKERGRVKPSALPYKFCTVKSFSNVHDTIINPQKSKRQSNERPLQFWEHWPLVGASQSSFIAASLSSFAADEDGYDSDPGFTYSKTLLQRSTSPRSVQDDGHSSIIPDCFPNPYSPDEARMYRTVEETMNMTWNLVWIRNNRPVQVQIWIERGTLIQKNWVMVEPRLMWRPTGSASGTPEFSIRLLQVCRIQESHRACAGAPSMCRSSASFVVRTIQKDAFWFQAAKSAERDALVQEWKTAIARLATLAVLEDTKPLLKEFFLAKEKDYY